jgi:hypothetical protein
MMLIGFACIGFMAHCLKSKSALADGREHSARLAPMSSSMRTVAGRRSPPQTKMRSASSKLQNEPNFLKGWSCLRRYACGRPVLRRIHPCRREQRLRDCRLIASDDDVDVERIKLYDAVHPPRTGVSARWTGRRWCSPPRESCSSGPPRERPISW